MTTEVSLKIRMTLAEICTGKMSCARSCCCCCPQRWCLEQFSSLLFSALTQFFQIFPEYQSNEFYATGEVRFRRFRFHLSYLFLNIINPSACSLTQGSTFPLFPTTSTKTTPLPKWRSTSLEWRLVTDSVIQKRFVHHQILLAECSLSVLLKNTGKYGPFKMLGGYGDFMYQTGMIDELQQQYVIKQTDLGVTLIQQQKWVEAFQVGDWLWITVTVKQEVKLLFPQLLTSGFWWPAERWPGPIPLLFPKHHRLHKLLQLHDVSGINCSDMLVGHDK